MTTEEPMQHSFDVVWGESGKLKAPNFKHKGGERHLKETQRTVVGTIRDAVECDFSEQGLTDSGRGCTIHQ